MPARTMHQCPSCERSYEKREQARNCGCEDRTIEQWECSECGCWWDAKKKQSCCDKHRDEHDGPGITTQA